MKLFLSPHFDDESLFGAYTLLRHRPLVVICFAGSHRHGDPDVRRGETAAALGILGPCEFKVLQDGDDLVAQLSAFSPDEVWAPLPEAEGHSEHNRVGEAATELWPGRVTFYTTYTMAGGRTKLGKLVEPEPEWVTLKRAALACYPSQLAHPGTRPHFERPLDEYLVDGAKL